MPKNHKSVSERNDHEIHLDVHSKSQFPKDVNELLEYDDKMFVSYAYRTLLGREPDPEGITYYLDRMRIGFSKISILAQIYCSDEAKTKKLESKLSGIDEVIARYKWHKTPVIGVILRMVGFKN